MARGPVVTLLILCSYGLHAAAFFTLNFRLSFASNPPDAAEHSQALPDQRSGNETSLSGGTIGGSPTSAEQHKPPPARFCILDKASATPELFRMKLEELKEHARATGKLQLWNFLLYDRDLGYTSLSVDNAPTSYCPRFPIWNSFDWACHLRRANGIFKFDTPFEGVQSIALNNIFADKQKCTNGSRHCDRAEERGWLRDGLRYQHCREGCDCKIRRLDQHPTVCQVNDLLRMFYENKGQYLHKKNSITLVLSGEDTPWLSKVAKRATQWAGSYWFRRIFYESVDVRMRGIDTFLKGLDMHYMLGRESLFLEAALQARVTDEAKPKLALGAWGKRGGPTLTSKQSGELADYIHGLGNVSWVEHKMIPELDYFDELSKYKFLIAPHGNGIQSPKFLEAVMVLTIPVTKRAACFVQLQEYGLPIVLVEKWSDVTEELLVDAWQRLSPTLERARWIGTNEGAKSLYFEEC